MLRATQWLSHSSWVLGKLALGGDRVMAEYHMSHYNKWWAGGTHLQEGTINSAKGGGIQGIITKKRYLLISFVFYKFLWKSYSLE